MTAGKLGRLGRLRSYLYWSKNKVWFRLIAALQRRAPAESQAREALVEVMLGLSAVGPIDIHRFGEVVMIASKIFRLLTLVGLALGALEAPTQAAVYQASTTVPLFGLGGGAEADFLLPKYSGPGTIIGVNIELSGSATATDDYPYFLSDGITVAPYSSTLAFPLFLNEPDTSFLVVFATAHFPGGSVPPCTDPACGGSPGDFATSSNLTPFSGSANLTDFSDFAGGGSNSFESVVFGGFDDTLIGSVTLKETILTTAPEPPTWVTALIGFAVVGFAARSRRVANRAKLASDPLCSLGD
jgi:hypothetical protein